MYHSNASYVYDLRRHKATHQDKIMTGLDSRNCSKIKIEKAKLERQIARKGRKLTFKL